MNIEANSFSGKYGSLENIADIIHIQIKVESDNIWTENKEIIFLIDVSGSMESSIKAVKSSMLAFRDAIVGKTAREMEQMDKFEKDAKLREVINVRIITFSSEATEIWSSQSVDLFEDTIINLETESMTNMGDALELAFDKINPHKYNWVITMTDGNSNKGPCKTAGAFQRLITTKKPLNTKIVSLGYGENFDPEVLNRVGNFVYVENSEMIPVVLGNLAAEIMTSIGFNCIIDIPNRTLPSELNDDTIIVPDGEDMVKEGKIIVGDRVIGTLCSGKTYDYIYLPHGNNISRGELHKYKKVNIRFTDIITNTEHNIYRPIFHTNESPENKIQELYFSDESKRLIHKLYIAIQKGDTKKEVNKIKEIIECWNEDISQRYKDDILKLFEQIENSYRRDKTASMTLNYAVGTGYTQRNENGYAGSTLSSASHYLMSPLLD